ncbi:MAG: agmatine deiminase [Butyrivibrio sp.]|nr:agmatine deiminase [Butyrivibrio sp.]
MPAEYDFHLGTLMIWPTRPGSWGKDKKGAQKAFSSIFQEILESENLFLIVSRDESENAVSFITFNSSIIRDRIITIEDRLELTDIDPNSNNLYLVQMDTDDSWARDVGPTYVKTLNSEIRGVDWRFNAWGGEFDGLYASWDKDDAVASAFCELTGTKHYDAHPFVLEGGSIHCDGEGTVMVTEACLLSKGRNPELSREEIEDKLKEYLGAQKVLWLPSGIYNDETNEHVDNVCAFTAPGEVVLAWTDNKDDPQYEMSSRDLEYLESVTDARNRHLKIHKLPVPDVPVCCTKEDIDNYVFEEGEDEREVGERLAASYVNFYFTNNAVLVPQFGGENTESDKRAVQILADICKNRKIIPIDARAILLGGGNIHCITQQIPACVSNMKRKVINFE